MAKRVIKVGKIMRGEEKTFRKFRIYNALMGFFHLAQGVAMLWLSNAFALPITTQYLNFNKATSSLFQQPQTLWSLRIGPAVASFLFISALAHFLTSTVLYKWYVEKLKQHINIIRWVEYSFSSSIMIVIISMLVGVYDLSSLILLFTVNAGMILFGWMMEKHNQVTVKTNWTSYIFGCIMGIVPWIVITLYLVGSAQLTSNAVPTFVYWIFGTLFVFFNIFAINQLLQYLKVGKWKNYLYGEAAYILLSLVAKSLLAWQVFFGTLRPM